MSEATATATTTSETTAVAAATTTTKPTINHRILLSLREAGSVIGQQGSTIQDIRVKNNVKIGISPKEKGCSDRILSCAGDITSVCHAIGDVMEVLNRSRPEEEEHHVYKLLNFMLPPPSPQEIKDLESIKHIGNLRLIVTNSQVSSIIGVQGKKIKSLIDKHGVKIVASKNFLPDSNDRVLEIQGFPGSITNCLVEISEILLNEIDIKVQPEKRYYPHASSTPASAEDPSSTSTNVPAVQVVAIPSDFVGALLGHGGNRIANLRKYTKTKIVVGTEPNSQGDREFTITSDDQRNVKLAESMLLKNLKAEMERREERQAKE